MFAALVYGWFLSVGLGLRVYSRRKLPRALITWWAFMVTTPLIAFLWATGLDARASHKAIEVGLFAVLGVLIGVASLRIETGMSRRLGLALLVDRSRRRRARSDALRELNERIRRNPRDANAFAERSKVRLARGEALRAIGDLDKALQLDRKNAHHFLYLKHLVRLSQDDFAHALQDILSAIEIDEYRREDYYAAAAIVYVKWGRIDGVAAMLEKQGLPVSRTHAVQVSALNAVLFDVDREIAVRTAMLSERRGSGDQSRLNSLRQARADILAKLRKFADTPSNVGFGR
ncbi:MAG: hypothetical protein H7Y89_11170 [Steroidobacteraceae bacterium]|nr:hypothetical protein [Steroidobacteraceae bacterium]